MTPFQRERCQIDPRLLAKFDKRQPHVCIPMQVLARNLVKHRNAAEVVASFQEQPDERTHLFGRTDRIPERGPRASLHAVHDEPGLVLIEENGLVAQEHEIREGRGLCLR